VNDSGRARQDRPDEADSGLDELFADLSQRRVRAGAVRLKPVKPQLLRKRFEKIYAAVRADFKATGVVTRAQEWLLDNRHIIEESLESLRENFPRAFLRTLPGVTGELAVSTHVEALAFVLVDSDRQPLELTGLERQVQRYQTRRVLTIGELWALPSALRRALLEQLAEAAERSLRVSENELVAATDRIAEGVTSLRVLGNCDWQVVFERLCRVERILARDPARAYSGMDFESRNTYRSRVEELARGSRHTETEVAERILEQCRAAPEGRERHVGYALVSDGWDEIARALGFRPTWYRRFLTGCRRWPGWIYFSLTAVLSLLPTAALALMLIQWQKPTVIVLCVPLIALVPLMGLATAVVNSMMTWMLPPRRLSRLSLKHGVPSRWRTVVTVPVLLGDARDVDNVFATLEKNFLGNDDPEIVFAVLGDLADADQATVEEDQVILDRAGQHIDRLNRQYGSERAPSRFLFFNRERQWNPSENCWMGWERKRGKLMEFNNLLAGGTQTSYTLCLGDEDALSGTRYVITLDADTRMPPGAARQMIGTLAHPLSQAVIDESTGELLHGYSIIQPRLEVDPESTRATRFTHVFSGDSTLDLYTTAASDTYHDLFGHGIFTGKGIYDWLALERILGERIPENTLLSHDLLEGVHGAVGLASDIVLLEQYPPTVMSFLRRAHRWVRGDWQLLPWLMPKVPMTDGRRITNPLSLIHLWKIIDNLRRSLQPIALLVLLLLAWSGILVGPAWVWTLAVVVLLGTSLLSEVFSLFLRCLGAPRHIGQFLRVAPTALGRESLFWLYSLILLPAQAWFMADAIGRTLWRILISRKHLLQWKAAAQVNESLLNLTGAAVRWGQLWVSPALAVLAGSLVAVFNPSAGWTAAPVLLVWFFAPEWARWADRLITRPAEAITEEDEQRLRLIARRTWLFFDQFVGPDDSWLPPDNYQDEPRVLVAHRTSPTNIGMALNAGLAAHDFGWLDTRSLLAWMRNITESMSRMQTYRGHWFNWYDTQSLKPLHPCYVSTVDSGNLAAALLTQARGLDEIQTATLDPLRFFHGLKDTLSVLSDAIKALPDGGGKPEALAPLLDLIEQLKRQIEATSHETVWSELERWKKDVLADLVEAVLELGENEEVVVSAETLAEFRVWISQLKRQVRRARDLIVHFWPWMKTWDPWPSDDAEPGLGRNLDDLRGYLVQPRSPADWPGALVQARGSLASIRRQIERQANDRSRQALEAFADLDRKLAAGIESNQRLCREAAELSALLDGWVRDMDFSFLYDDSRELFSIGFDSSNGLADANCYDLLASESRLTSLLAIAKGDVPPRHWIHLGRPLRRKRNMAVLMSWSATLFEYLMPSLYLKTPSDSLTGRGMKTAILLHRQFCQPFGIPWGISESAYYQFDDARQYQYRAFGIPALGFRRDLGDRLVIAPYSSIMALRFGAATVMKNLDRLEQDRALGLYGLVEAVDYGSLAESASLRPRLVRTWMSHHQGMVLMAINNALNDDRMIERFHSDPRISSVAMLLHERVPLAPAPIKARREYEAVTAEFEHAGPISWTVPDDPAARQFAVLSNGQLTTLIAQDGVGGLSWQGLALTHFEADDANILQGYFIYLKDLDSGEFFRLGDRRFESGDRQGHALFGPHRADLHHAEMDLACHMAVGVSARHDLEARKLSVTNQSERPRRLMVVSFAPLAMAPPREFRRHPAFARLFVESECLADERTLIFRRRPRDVGGKPVYLAHSLVIDGGRNVRFAWDTDRSIILGRNGSARRPALLQGDLGGFSGSLGTVLDPAIATGVEVHLEAYERLELAILTGVNRSRRALLSSLESYRSLGRVDWMFEQARMQTSQEFGQLGLKPDAAIATSRLLSAILSPRPEWRQCSARPKFPLQSMLWSRGISGDWPVIIARVHDDHSLDAIQQLAQIHCLLAGRQVATDLVLLDDPPGVYDQPVRDELRDLIEAISSRSPRSLLGRVRVLSTREMNDDECQALEAAAAVIIDTRKGPLIDQLLARGGRLLPPLVPVPSHRREPSESTSLQVPEAWATSNGYGDFVGGGREYLIHLEPGQSTPAPWSNVLANPGFGCLVTESGTSCTWATNSSEFRLTPWPNDPVADGSGEVLYLRDEENGEFWSVTPQPRPAPGAHQIHHKPGATEFNHSSHGLHQQLLIHVDASDPVKICRLRVRNDWSWTRRITATYFVEWVLGNHRGDTRMHLRSDLDRDSMTLLVNNLFDPNRIDDYGFLCSDQPVHGFTTDRQEFLGTNGSTSNPAALHRIGLDGRLEPGQDDCAALQVHLDISAGETREVVFVIGHARGREAAVELARRFTARGSAQTSAERADTELKTLLEAVRVKTPDADFDRMINYWLPYQTLNGRLIGRTGYYQSSGAFGFRDQLQDAMAMVWLRPTLTRRQILSAASRQFVDGDVLHWWHEQPLSGVRSRCSDDLLWLPLVTAYYVRTTGDRTVLDESVPYLDGEPLAPEVSERYTIYMPSETDGSLYQHCCKAIEHAASVGPHGLPTIGSGDWNDGFNQVSTTGRGESVWLGWFMLRVLREFTQCCELQGDSDRAEHYDRLYNTLSDAIDESAWDGEWYRRAYYDDGTPIGSKDSDECRIDLIAQTWSVIGPEQPGSRSKRAMQSANEHLVDEEARLIKLLTPPFDEGQKHPGYIKGYPPGIRENGAQYTHAATWAVWAMARLRDGDRAMHLFRLLLPNLHSDSRERADHYRIEPYVMAGDIYSVGQNRGRGGWSWYTGASSWLYRAGLEALLGLTLEGDRLMIDPCLPSDWKAFEVILRRGGSVYRIAATRSGRSRSEDPGVRVVLDGIAQKDSSFAFVDDGVDHEVEVVF